MFAAQLKQAAAKLREAAQLAEELIRAARVTD
jgi:hypothetical protein